MDTKLPAGPFRVAADAPAVIVDRHGQTAASACGPHDDAFAARIVACVTACAGIPDSALTGAGSVAPAAAVTCLQVECDRLRAQVAELAAALDGLRVWHPAGEECWCNGGRTAYRQHQAKCIAARAALAKVDKP